MTGRKLIQRKAIPAVRILMRSAHRRVRPRLRSIEAALRRATPVGHRGERAEILFTTDAHIASLAGRYRGSPHPTDVLAFPGGEAGFGGSIAISLDAARRQARERGVTLTEELILLSVHGLLHLDGQGDESMPDWCAMRVREFETLVRIL